MKIKVTIRYWTGMCFLNILYLSKKQYIAQGTVVNVANGWIAKVDKGDPEAVREIIEQVREKRPLPSFLKYQTSTKICLIEYVNM
jgi:hypothetical protein